LQVRTVATAIRTLPLAAYILAGTLGALSLVSWLVVADANMPMIGMFDPQSLVLFTAIWGVGMVAMMFPSLIPMVYTIAVSSRKSDEAETRAVPYRTAISASSVLFILTYVAIWTLVGTGFYLTISALTLTGFPVSVAIFSILAGPIIILVGLYQFTRFKQDSLMKCRSPMTFILTRWRGGKTGAAWMGADYGLFCTKCCWALMAGLLTVGAMSLPLMGVFAIIIFTEKIVPFGALISKLVGAGFLAVGIFLLATIL
jgi:predicted metal-binding membrane protein